MAGNIGCATPDFGIPARCQDAIFWCRRLRRSGRARYSAAGVFSLGNRTVNRVGYGAMQLAGPGGVGRQCAAGSSRRYASTSPRGCTLLNETNALRMTSPEEMRSRHRSGFLCHSSLQRRGISAPMVSPERPRSPTSFSTRQPPSDPRAKIPTRSP